MGRDSIWTLLTLTEISSAIGVGTLTGQIYRASLKFARLPRGRSTAGVSPFDPSLDGSSHSLTGPVLSLNSGVTLCGLRYDHCRWPIGDPHTSSFVFCGEQKGDKSRYCDKHHAIAYRPVEPIDLEE